LEGLVLITTIHRKYKHEAELAVSDLLKRGWVVDYPITEIKSAGTERGDYNYMKSKYTSRQGTMASCWVE
jgi:hypothetical protein